MLGSCSDVIYENEDFSWSSEKVTQGDYSAYAKSENEIVSNYPLPDGKERRWTKKNDISRFGKYTGTDTLETALYNMAADELLNNVEADSTFRTGALWAGVWTRDISYSIILSLSDLLPDISRISLMRKVDRLGRIVQDTGTGGSWPCSSDRVIWAVAAWKIYLATGDKDWLNQAYATIKRSLEDDLAVTFDAETCLFRGESSFIDWRQQSYPRWMQPADIFKSECLGTNVVYYMVLQAMTKMAATQGFEDDREYYSSLAEKQRAVDGRLRILRTISVRARPSFNFSAQRDSRGISCNSFGHRIRKTGGKDCVTNAGVGFRPDNLLAANQRRKSLPQ